MWDRVPLCFDAPSHFHFCCSSYIGTKFLINSRILTYSIYVSNQKYYFLSRRLSSLSSDEMNSLTDSVLSPHFKTQTFLLLSVQCLPANVSQFPYKADDIFLFLYDIGEKRFSLSWNHLGCKSSKPAASYKFRQMSFCFSQTLTITDCKRPGATRHFWWEMYQERRFTGVFYSPRDAQKKENLYRPGCGPDL